MRLWPRTLAGQLIALLLAALAIAQIVAFIIFSDERSEALRRADRLSLLENTASVLRMLRLAPSEIRPRLAREASSPRVRFSTSAESSVPPMPADAQPVDIARLFSEAVRDQVRVLVIREDDVARFVQQQNRRGFIPFENERFNIRVSVPGLDSGWINAETQISGDHRGWPWPTIASTAVMGIAILLIVAFSASRATRPLRAIASRADALGRGTPDEPPLEEKGPDEIRSVTVAFNRMQERLQRFVSDRVRMIAAIGHDLRTPLTSLKLRVELLDDEEAKTKITATLDEMQQMIEATLSFARDEAAAEPARSVDLAALVASAVDDHADIGKDVRYAEAPRLTYRCRPTALKRAVSNLIDNAVQYGERARVSLGDDPLGPMIAIEDRGPGIPPTSLEDVFQPFVRIETSRSRATGGVGLGLSIARSIVLAHGGELVLKNLPDSGLRAEIRLPKEDSAGMASDRIAG